MLSGTADISTLARNAPTISAYHPDPILFEQVICYQLTVEMHNQARQQVLPPALHPTVPPALSIQAWQVSGSPWGDFSMVINRVSCRSGVRARGYTTQVIVSEDTPCKQLSGIFGYPCTLGNINFFSSYSGIELSVMTGDRIILEVTGTDPEPMGLQDVQYTSDLNLAHTPNGLRMVQCEVDHHANRVDRLVSDLLYFDPEAWGNPLFDPYIVVSSSVCTEEVTFKPVRFVCKLDELAFTGTEPVVLS